MVEPISTDELVAAPDANCRVEMPEFRSPFVGREEDLEKLKKLVSSSRVVTLVGPPGVGKTRLATKLALELHREEFGAHHGVWATTLRDVRSTTGVVLTVGELLNIPLESVSNAREAVGLIGDWLSNKRLLLVLDNLDQVAETAGWMIEQWVESAPGCRFAVTSRAAMEIDDETVYDVETLDLGAATKLYRQLAVRAGSSSRDVLTRSTVKELVNLLDRLPLSIELAAGRLPVLGPTDIAENAGRQLDVLQEPSEDRSRWEATLRHSIARSWDALSPAERSTMMQLSLFEGGCTLEAAESIIDIDEVAPKLSVSQALQNLLSKSLVYVEMQDDGGRAERRFELYAAVREFASDRFDDFESRERVIERYIDEWVERAEELVERLPRQMQTARLGYLREQRNVLNAFHLAVERSPLKAARLAETVAQYRPYGFVYTDRVELFERAADALEEIEDQESLDRLVARTQYRLWEARWDTRDNPDEDLEKRFESVLQLARDADDTFSVVGSLQKIALLNSVQGEAERGLERLREAIAIAAEAGDRRLEAMMLKELADVHFRTGQVDEAVEGYEQSLERFDQAPDPLNEAVVFYNLANLKFATGDLVRARELLSEAEKLYEELDLRGHLYYSESLWSEIHLVEGAFERAAERAQRAVDLCREYGRKWHLGTFLIDLGAALYALGDFESAEQKFEEAKKRARKSGVTATAGHAAGFLAATAYREGQIDRGDSHMFSCGDMLAENSPIVDVFRGFRDLALARKVEEGENDEHLEQALRRTETDVHTDAGAIAASILRHELADLGAAPEPAESDEPRLQVERREAAWFEYDGERADISTRGAFKRILQLLVEQRSEQPGKGVDTYELLDAGWPDDEPRPEAGAARVYHAISELRKQGLRDILLRDDRGYYLDPDVAIRRR